MTDTNTSTESNTNNTNTESNTNNNSRSSNLKIVESDLKIENSLYSELSSNSQTKYN